MSLSIMHVVLAAILILLGIGFYGFLMARNLMKIIVAMQILVKAAMLALVMAGRYSGEVNLGQSLAITVIVADTIVVVLALAFVVQVRRYFGTLDVKALTMLRK
ncbi:MAG TPA: NADH-quinone oxidoreductase subunit K [Levilinea sp.]|nr:NADH-quinone oxidoreductase subunit K [Levilinea sp.]